jgi:hypothetical protein
MNIYSIIIIIKYYLSYIYKIKKKKNNKKWTQIQLIKKQI